MIRVVRVEWDVVRTWQWVWCKIESWFCLHGSIDSSNIFAATKAGPMALAIWCAIWLCALPLCVREQQNAWSPLASWVFPQVHGKSCGKTSSRSFRRNISWHSVPLRQWLLIKESIEGVRNKGYLYSFFMVLCTHPQSLFSQKCYSHNTEFRIRTQSNFLAGGNISLRNQHERNRLSSWDHDYTWQIG